MEHFNLIRIGCMVIGIAFTRLSNAVPSFLGFILVTISMGLFIFPIAYELYTNYQYTETEDPVNSISQKSNRKKIVYQFLIQLPLICATYFIMLLGIKWLQGETPLLKNAYDTASTLNMAIILTSFCYIYVTHIRSHVYPFLRKKNQAGPDKDTETK